MINIFQEQSMRNKQARSCTKFLCHCVKGPNHITHDLSATYLGSWRLGKISEVRFKGLK
jgi:hypothetical protein